MQYTFALSGNPNVGKTSLYNRLTHSFEHVGNWHGVTVDKKLKKIRHNGDEIDLIDLPGLYSLTVYSPEEAVSRDDIIKNANTLNLNICEANNIPRNLYLTLQLLELGTPVMLVINMMDELYKQGKTVDKEKLEQRLRLPVMLVSAKKGFDAKSFLNEAKEYSGKFSKNIILPYLEKLPLNEVKKIIGNKMPEDINPTFVCLKVLEGDDFVIGRLRLDEKQLRSIRAIGDKRQLIAKLRYDYIDYLTRDIIISGGKTSKIGKFNNAVSEHADKLALNKFLALPIFLLIMSGIIWFTFGFAGKYLSDLMSDGKDFIVLWLNKILSSHVPEWINALICFGIIDGVGGVIVFLPQIAILFFFLALLEDSGYISRVAFMTDGLFRKIGLSGRAVFTLIMGLGCSASAVLTSRGLEDPLMRKKTVILTPFMSCSARLPVYTAVAAAFFASSNAAVIFGLYLLGAITVVAIAAIMQNTPLKSGETSFIMEMPRYRLPTAERVVQIIWNNVKTFIIKVGTIVFALNVIVWILGNFSLSRGFVSVGSGESVMEILGSFIAPLFAPLGFGNWRAVTALLSGLVAKESVISTITSLGGIEKVLPDSLAAICFLVYTLLYVPCIATLGSVRKEAGTKWMFLGLFMQLTVAYAVTFMLRITVLAFIKGIFLGFSTLIIEILVILTLVEIIKTLFGKRRVRCRGDCNNCV